MATAGACIKAKCMACLGIEKGQQGFDCGAGGCPLYACSPMRGRKMSAGRAPDGGERQSELDRIAALHTSIPKRQPSKAFIAAMCRNCQPESRDHCTATCGTGEVTDCALLPLTPLQPGKQPRTPRSEKQQEAAREQGEILRQRAQQTQTFA